MGILLDCLRCEVSRLVDKFDLRVLSRGRTAPDRKLARDTPPLGMWLGPVFRGVGSSLKLLGVLRTRPRDLEPSVLGHSLDLLV